MSGSDARRILVIILSAGSRYLDQGRSELAARARGGQWDRRRRVHAIASKTRLELLIRGEPA